MTQLINGDRELRRLALGSWQGWLAFGFGSGLSHHAPGTVGTIASVPLAYGLTLLPGPLAWLILAGAFLAGVYCCEVCSRQLGQHDPGAIVWDEMVAFCLTVMIVPASWPWWLAAFVLFRLFDILKPWPIRALEKRFGGGFGIMLDDLVAALMAMAVLALAGQLLQSM